MKGNHYILLDKQIGMEPRAIDWAKEEAKMATIVRDIHVFMFIVNNSIFKSII